jgi:hydroxypyruvate isomerase
MTAFRFSANLGYLWTDLPFLERIRRAAANGFDAIEFHDNARGEDRAAFRDVLAEAGLPVLGLNIRMGESVGCAAIPEAADQVKRDIAEAIEIAEDIGAGAIHVLAGKASGPAAHDAYIEALKFALAHTGLTILIEPVCAEQVPGFFLRTIEQAGRVLAEIDHPRLKIMFDCYHVHRESGSLLAHFRNHASKIGHVQIASADGRAEPFPGELDYSIVLPAFQEAGYTGYFGCEYRPCGKTEEGLSWRATISKAPGHA